LARILATYHKKVDVAAKSALPTKTVDNFVGTARIGVFSPAMAGPQPLWRFNDRPANKQPYQASEYPSTAAIG